MDIGEVLESALTMGNNEFRHRAMVDVDIEPTGRVLIDPGQLGQVFVNLLINERSAINRYIESARSLSL